MTVGRLRSSIEAISVGIKTEDGSESVLLFEVIAAEAGFLVHFVCEVEVAAFEIFFECRRLTDFAEEVLK